MPKKSPLFLKCMRDYHCQHPTGLFCMALYSFSSVFTVDFTSTFDNIKEQYSFTTTANFHADIFSQMLEENLYDRSEVTAVCLLGYGGNRLSLRTIPLTISNPQSVLQRTLYTRKERARHRPS